MSNNNNLNSIKIILLGDTGVGKTSIIKGYCDNKYEENPMSTLYSNYFEKIITIKGQKVKLELWDTAGQEEYRSLTKLFVKNSKIIILVYDITNKKTFECLNYWYDFIEKEIGKDVIIGLAGNKNDLIFQEEFKEEVNFEEAKEYAEKIEANFSLVSAKESSKEIINLFEQCVNRYLDTIFSGDKPNLNIKLDDNIKIDNNNKGQCCAGKSKNSHKIKMLFLGCNGVGKTSLIKAIKGNNINNLTHTKNIHKEEITYSKNGQRIIVQLKDTNGDECKNEIFNKAIDGCKVFFLVFDVYKKDTLYNLENWLKKINSEGKKVYLLGYSNDSLEYKDNEFDCSKEVEKFTSKYKCEYEAISIEDIYKIKAIILENIDLNIK